MRFDKPKQFIDASVFMGMHATDSRVRGKSIGLMSKLFNSTVYMNYEQVGACDDYVWTFSRKVQDEYYPFMDCLHSQMDIQRIPYINDDVMLSLDHEYIRKARLSSMQSLLVAQVLRCGGILFTHDPKIQELEWFSACLGNFQEYGDRESEGIIFTAELDDLYQMSNSLQVTQISFG